jgi:hypothetical protein
MRTPAGVECRYYYEDFNRGRETQECRLIKANRQSLAWSPDLCAKCPVPEVLRANGSPDLRLTLAVGKRFGLLRSLRLVATCAKHAVEIPDPIRGCPRCAQEPVS